MLHPPSVLDNHDTQERTDACLKKYTKPEFSCFGDITALVQNMPPGPGLDGGGFDTDTSS